MYSSVLKNCTTIEVRKDRFIYRMYYLLRKNLPAALGTNKRVKQNCSLV